MDAIFTRYFMTIKCFIDQKNIYLFITSSVEPPTANSCLTPCLAQAVTSEETFLLFFNYLFIYIINFQ